MAGILDKKSRIMDVIVTEEGRRQIQAGDFRARFASFTDGESFYEFDAVSGSTDPTERIYFEAFNDFRDKIMFETDDQGQLIGLFNPIENTDVVIVGNGQLYTTTNTTPMGTTFNPWTQVPSQPQTIPAVDFAAAALSVITSSIEHFKKLQMIGSEKGDDVNPMTFDMSENKLYFEINNRMPFGSNPNNHVKELETLPPLFNDTRLNHLPHFRYLPPVNRGGIDTAQFSSMKPSTDGLDIDDIMNNLGGISNLPEDYQPPEDEYVLNSTYDYEVKEGFLEAYQDIKANASDNIVIEKRTVNIKNTSPVNNMFIQVFEVIPEQKYAYEVDDLGNPVDFKMAGTNRKLLKLDVIDAGEHKLSDQVAANFNQERNPYKQVYYVGKIFRDDETVPVFINIFTLIFD
jgi:hypothetical protein